MKLGLCVLGCGNFAKHFASSIQPLLPNIDLFFASRNINKAKDYCDIYNGSGAFGSYYQAVNTVDVQAVYICTPHHLHFAHTQLAASAGKHVLVEKPIANSVDTAKKLIKSAKEANIILMVAENYRFMSATRLCKELVDHNAIGQIRTIQVQQESYYQLRGWRKNIEKSGGGIFIDAGIHKVHFLRYLLGEPECIYALTPGPTGNKNSDNACEDGLVFVSKWSNGQIGLIYHSWTTIKEPTTHWAIVSGTEGRIYFEIGQPTLRLDSRNGSNVISLSEPLDGIAPMVEEFICSISENRLPEVSGEEGLKDLELVEKAYESVSYGAVVLNQPLPNIN